MNINSFFLIILALLIIIFVSFEPMEIKKHKNGEIPLFELTSFTVHELNLEGLTTVMKGGEALRFKDRYEVDKIDYTDNSKESRANIKADKGIYTDESETLSLDGDIIYLREDGLTFKTQELLYNQKTSIATTDKSYIMYRDDDEIVGSSLVYDNTLEKISSKNITAKYQLQEEKQ